MIAADKNNLQATLTQGVLNLQFKLVQLYTTNLTALGTVSALIASFVYSGMACGVFPNNNPSNGTYNPNSNPGYHGLEYLFFVFSVISLMTGVFAVSQTTIVTMFGPALALSGSTPGAVTLAVDHMSQRQTYALLISVVCVATLVLSCCVCDWDRLFYGIAAMNSFIYFGIFYLMVREGLKAYALFKLEDKLVKPPKTLFGINRTKSLSSSNIEDPDAFAAREKQAAVQIAAEEVMLILRFIHLLLK